MSDQFRPSPNSPHAGVTNLGQTLSPWLSQTTFPARGTSLRCGVSGGADSLALMALGVAAGCEVAAIHIDHGQRTGSENEAEVVASYAASIGASFESHTVDVAPGSNLEARMRTARYEVLGQGIATGHTADDQAETLLINLVRGAGLVGLGAMEPGHRYPILALRRKDTEAVCSVLGWTPIVDESNADPAFLRNRMRHEVLPLLDEISERDVVPLLNRSSSHARDGARFIEAHADLIDPADAKQLAAAPGPVAAFCVQQWIRRETGDEHRVDAASIERVLRVARGEVLAAEVNGGWRICRSQQRLTIEPAKPREARSQDENG